MLKIIKYLSKCLIILSTFITFNCAQAENLLITGAGATFPYPIYAKWAQKFAEKTGVQLNYQSIGSGGGIKQIQAGTVDFGATDKPLDNATLSKNKLMQFPTVIGGVVPVINLEGINPGQIKLSPEVLANIFLGKITNWNDPAIAALNSGISLPDQHIIVVHRSDGSGTTFIFTDYLSKISEEWKNKVGENTAVDWPTGIGGKGNEGVAAYVQQVKGAIGYVEFAYAMQNQLTYVQLKNKNNQFVSPSIDSFSAAAIHANWQINNNFNEILTDQPGDNSWPITGATFILLHTNPADPGKTKTILQFFDWAYQNGQDMAIQLGYVPLPRVVVKQVENAWATLIKNSEGVSVWP